MVLWMRDDLSELKYLFRRLIDQLIVNVAALSITVSVTILIWHGWPFNVPHGHSGVIWWDQRFAVGTLWYRMYMVLMHISEGVSQLDSTRHLTLPPVNAVDSMQSYTALPCHPTHRCAMRVRYLQHLGLLRMDLVVKVWFWKDDLAVGLKKPIYKGRLPVNLIECVLLILLVVSPNFVHELLA